jgi:hypothetical protein
MPVTHLPGNLARETAAAHDPVEVLEAFGGPQSFPIDGGDQRIALLDISSIVKVLVRGAPDHRQMIRIDQWKMSQTIAEVER